jgi:hypothetical protein
MKKTLAILATTLSILPVVANAFPIASTGEGLNVLVGGTDPIIAKYEGNSAAYSNDLYLMLDMARARLATMATCEQRLVHLQ